jgi:hypothetical protein
VTLFEDVALARDEAVETLKAVNFPGLEFHVGLAPDLYLQVVHPHGVCNVSGKPTAWRGRKWRLSPHMTKGEIVQTAFLAVMTAMEHEIREQFTYRGVSVFDPHYDIDRLVELRRDPTSIAERAQRQGPRAA